MTNRTAIGTRVEDLVVPLLKERGYDVVERNFRLRRAEIDVIAWHDGTLCFLEIRSKSSRRFGSPEESLTEAKARKLRLGARAYLARWGDSPLPPCRFDFVAVEISADRRRIVGLRLLENVLPF